MSQMKLILTSIAVMAAANVSAQTGEGIHQMGECYLRGSYSDQAVEWVGDRMYITNHYGIEIWNMEDPANPELMRTKPFPRPITCGTMIISENLIFVGSSNYLWILDISDPGNPQLLSELQGHYYDWINQLEATQLQFTGFAEFVLIDNTIVALSNGNNLASIDVSDPIHPDLVDEVILAARDNAFGPPGQLVVHNNQVLLCGATYSREFAVIVYALEDSELELVSDSRCEDAPFDDLLSNSGEAVVHEDELIYIIGQTEEHLIHAIDISNPEEPIFTGSVEVPLDLLFPPFSYDLRFDLNGDILCFYNPFSVGIVNLESGFEDLDILGNITFYEIGLDDMDDYRNLSSCCDIVVNDSELVSIHSGGEIKVYEFTDPGDIHVLFDNAEDPALRGRPIVVQFDRKDDIIYCGSLSWHSNHRGCPSLISIADPTAPRLINNRLRDATESFFHVFGDLDRLVLHKQTWYNTRELSSLVIFDISDAADPQFIHEYDSPDGVFPNLIDTQGDVAVFFDQIYTRFATADISNLQDIEIIVSLSLENMPFNVIEDIGANTVFIDGTDLYFGGFGWADDPEIYLYNIDAALNPDEPGDPELIQTYDISHLADSVGVVFALEIRDDIAYVITGNLIWEGAMITPWSQKLLVMDSNFSELISETDLPAFIGTPVRSNLPFKWQIQVIDSLAYLLNDVNGLYIYDVSDLDRSPELVGWYDTPGLATQISLVDSLILIADTWSLQILQLGDEPEQAVDFPENIIPGEFSISAVYPNPFNGQVTIALQIPHTTDVDLSIYDVTGRLVKRNVLASVNAGSLTHIMDLSDQSSGIYIVNAKSPWGKDLRRVVMLK